jgi:hypothetical protein
MAFLSGPLQADVPYTPATLRRFGADIGAFDAAAASFVVLHPEMGTPACTPVAPFVTDATHAVLNMAHSIWDQQVHVDSKPRFSLHTSFLMTTPEWGHGSERSYGA